jgi:hypothetical protein
MYATPRLLAIDLSSLLGYSLVDGCYTEIGRYLTQRFSGASAAERRSGRQKKYRRRRPKTKNLFCLLNHCVEDAQ